MNGSRRVARALALAVLPGLAAALPGCGRDPTRDPYDFSGAGTAALTVRIDEDVTGTTQLRRLDLSALGTVLPDGTVRFRFDGASHEIRTGDDRRFRRADTRDAAPVEEPRQVPDPAMRTVLDGLLDRPFEARFHPRDGLVSLSGIDAALAAAAPAGDDVAAEARDGLLSLVGDELLARELRNAGLGPVPEGVGRDGPISWTAEVFVPGSGLHTVRVHGNAGREHEGSAVRRGKGQPDGRTPPRGDPGPPPPLPVDPTAVSFSTETLHRVGDLRPIDGNTTTERPFGTRISTNTRLRFTFTVR